MCVRSTVFPMAGGLLLAICGPLAAQANQYPPKNEGSKHRNVRSWQEVFATSFSHTGRVESVDDKTMTVRCPDKDCQPVPVYEYHPVDLVAQGKLVKNADGAFAYRWKDVKKGDWVRIHGHFDDGEQKWYCLQICIDRRPGGKLPESQDPKNDGRYKKGSLLNDLDNGLDVDDEVIAKVFPPQVWLHPVTGQKLEEYPGGLDKEYQKKLDAIRAKAKKKEQELKATPPEKK